MSIQAPYARNPGYPIYDISRWATEEVCWVCLWQQGQGYCIKWQAVSITALRYTQAWQEEYNERHLG